MSAGRGRLQVAVMGVGSLGFHHARLLRDMPGAELVGVHDTDPARLTEVGEKLGVPTFASMDELADRVEAAVIAVPTTSHETVARAVVRRGIHVLIEKPIAPSLREADAILADAARVGATVQIGHVERFNGALRACEPYLEEPLFVECHRLAPFGPRGTDVAVVLDLMIHDLDLVLSLMGRPVTQIAAVGVPVLTSSPDIANARLEFEGGGVANLTASRVSVERTRKIRFFQRSGYISLDLAAGKGEFLRLKPEIAALLAEGNGGALAGVLENGAAGAGGTLGLGDIVERIELASDGAEPLKCELESFVAAARGEMPVAVTGAQGRDALAVALEIVRRIERHVVEADPALA